MAASPYREIVVANGRLCLCLRGWQFPGCAYGNNVQAKKASKRSWEEGKKVAADICQASNEEKANWLWESYSAVTGSSHIERGGLEGAILDTHSYDLPPWPPPPNRERATFQILSLIAWLQSHPYHVNATEKYMHGCV